MDIADARGIVCRPDIYTYVGDGPAESAPAKLSIAEVRGGDCMFQV